MIAPRLEMLGIRKRFGATVALDGVDLLVQPGEVHALVGENGAGKSTLMKVLSGAVRPDAGRMLLDGRPFAPRNPYDARAAGVAIVYQELNLAPHLTVAENLTLGIERHTVGIICGRAFRQRVERALATLTGTSDCVERGDGAEKARIDPDTVVRRLPPAARQLVEIARALLIEAPILVLDEPTSSLGVAEIEHLFAVIGRLRAAGVSIVYISHFLEEVQRVADAFTVLRDGRVAGAGRMQDTTLSRLVELTIGRRLDEMFPRVPHTIGQPLLRIERLCGRPLPVEANLTLHRGEILGVAGLIGAGRTELLRTIFALAPIRSGAVRVLRLSRAKHRDAMALRPDPASRLAQGVGLLSEDRQTEGVALSRTVAENVTLSYLAPLSRWGWVRPAVLRRTAQRWIERLGIRTRGPEQPVWGLSGGNQQKVALARLLHHDVDALLLDEPTRGIDVASKTHIYELLGQLAAQGKAILMVSSYMPELLGVCDRIAVMHRGRLGPARPVADWTEHALMTAAVSGTETAA